MFVFNHDFSQSLYYFFISQVLCLKVPPNRIHPIISLPFLHWKVEPWAHFESLEGYVFPLPLRLGKGALWWNGFHR